MKMIHFSTQFSDDSDRQIIQAGITEWEGYTCLKFQPAQPTDTNYVAIVNSDKG